MRILVDTNVILDYILEREPYNDDAAVIMKAVQEKVVSGCIAAHTITNIFYILRKCFTVEARRELLLELCVLFEVEEIGLKKLRDALHNERFDDFEDCLQMVCADNFHADYIVTRNIDDFKNSSVQCITPARFCKLLSDDE